MKIAIVGSGIAGNVVGYHLSCEHDITLYEAASHIGGHSHTHEVWHEGRQLAVDTGFIVFNRRTYPFFSKLLDDLGVEAQASEMSFSVQCPATGLEYNGTTLNRLFAQRSNLLRPTFWRMIRDILRFNREAPALLEDGEVEISIGDYLRMRGYSRQFVDCYILPMGAAIWTASPRTLQQFPARYFVRFFHNHGMLSINDRPQWLTIRDGSARYVERLTASFRDRIRLSMPVELVRRTPAGVMVKAAGCEPERYDALFLACHSDQALKLLADPSDAERSTLGAMRYQRNEVVLHRDTSVLPRRRLAWAAWNYHVLDRETDRVAVTYNMNLLQRLETRVPLLVSLNMTDRLDPAAVIKKLSYEHPIYTPEAVAAHSRQAAINGVNRTYFCGAYWRYGFHEDGVASALDAREHFRSHEHAQRALYRTA
ncbi:MAG: FAD-dependent oxidoreductase [Steroidobacteraceae bacterium]